MTQTASFKSRLKNGFSIFKWDLRNCSGALTVFAILAGVLITVTLTLCLVVGTASSVEDNAGLQYIPSAVTVFQLIATYGIFYMNAIATIVYTVRIYSYLHNKRKADMYFAMPVSRRTFYASKTVTAYLFSVVPTMFFMGLIAIISICFGAPVLEETARVYVYLLLGSAASISFYGLLAVCCGTTVNAVLSFLAINFAYPFTALFIKGTIKAFFYGMPANRYNNSFIMKALNPLAAYEGTNVIYWLIFTAACLFLGMWFVKKRKTECAQTSFAYYLPCHIVKLLVSFIAGMFLGTIFGSLNVLFYGLIGFMFGFIVGSVPAYIISHLILYKGFSRVFKSAIPFGAMIVVVFLLMAFCNLDPLGYNTYVPDAENIASAGLIELDDCYLAGKASFTRLSREVSDDFTDSKHIESIINCHKSIVSETKKDSSEKYVSVWTNMLASNFPSQFLYNNGYMVSYKLKNGMTVTRYYDNLDSMFYETNNSDKYAEEITGSDEYFRNYSAIMHVKAEDITTFKISQYGADGYQNCEVANKENKLTKQIVEDRSKVLEAFKKDVAEHGYNQFDSKLDYSKDGICQISISYKNDKMKTGSFLYNIVGDIIDEFDTSDDYYYIFEEDKNTLAALKEIGVLKANGEINYDSPYYKAGNYWVED